MASSSRRSPSRSRVRARSLVAVKAAALNFFDTLITRGKYQAKPRAAVLAVGRGGGRRRERWAPASPGVQVGDRVTAYLGWGGAREKVVGHGRSRWSPIPEAVSDAVAAGVCGDLRHGDPRPQGPRPISRPARRVAVLGASGGAGLAAVEIAKLMGARVIAVASSPEKLAVCREHGADEAVDYGSDDLKDGLRALTGGHGVDVVYDCVGGDSSEAALRAHRRGTGRFLVVGFASGDIPKIPLNLLLLKGCAAIGVFWGEAVKRDPGRASRQHAPGAGVGGRGAAQSAHPRHLSAGRASARRWASSTGAKPSARSC